MRQFHGSLITTALMACALSHAGYAANGANTSIETQLLGIIKTYSLQEVDEARCKKAIREALRGKQAKGCFGPYDKVLSESTTAPAVRRLAEPTKTVASETPGSWVYVRIEYFGLTTAEELYETIIASGRKRIILDLRYNGGGRLDQAFKIALLVADASANQAVYTETRRDTESGGFHLKTQTFRTRDVAERFYTDMPERVGSLRDLDIALLVDGTSISASEILAEIMRRLNSGRVFLVGHATQGKWSAQAWFPFTDADGMKRRLIYTVFQYAPGSDTEPPAHVIPDFSEGSTLQYAHERGADIDQAYSFARRKLVRMR